MASICDLGRESLVNIFTRIPITSLGAVRCTCKSWRSLSEELIVGEAAAARQQFVGFMSIAYKLYSVRFGLRGIDTEVEQSVKQVALFDHVEISNVLQVDGLVLLVTKGSSNLILWNPYLQQQRWIEPSRNFDKSIDRSRVAFGYDNNGNYKIFRFCYSNKYIEYEMYDLSSNMWTVLDDDTLGCSRDCNPRDWEILFFDQKVTLKGNSYFFTSKFVDDQEWGQYYSCLVCFDFTRENFGKPLDIPFRFQYIPDESTVVLSCVSEERLAILHHSSSNNTLDIWVTCKIDPNAASWYTFFRVSMAPRIASMLCGDLTFFIDEEKKVAVLLGLYWTLPSKLTPTAHIIRQEINGEYGCVKSVTTADAIHSHISYRTPVVSPYRPSLLHIKHKRKRHKRKRQKKKHG